MLTGSASSPVQARKTAVSAAPMATTKATRMKGAYPTSLISRQNERMTVGRGRVSVVIVVMITACGLSTEGTDRAVDAGSLVDGSTTSETDASQSVTDSAVVDVTTDRESGVGTSCAPAQCATGETCCIAEGVAPRCSSTCATKAAFVLACASASDCSAQGITTKCCLTFDLVGVSRSHCAASCDGAEATLCTEADKATACGSETPCVPAQCNGTSGPFATCRSRMNNFSNDTCKVFH